MSKNYTSNTIAAQYSIMKVWLAEAEISQAQHFLYSKYSLNFLRQGFDGTGYSSYICQC